MILEGKKAAFLGDSITEGHGLESTEGAYWNLLKKREDFVCAIRLFLCYPKNNFLLKSPQNIPFL